MMPEAEFGTESAANAALLMCKMLDAAAVTLQRDPCGPQAGAARKARDAIVAAVVARGRLQIPPAPRPFPSPLPPPPAYDFLVWTLRKLEVALRAVILARLRAAAAPSAVVDGATLRALLEQADVVRVPARELKKERARLDSIERRERLGLESMETPDEFLCPITYEVMRDPVVASDGHSYERAAIEHYHAQEGRRTSPLTLERTCRARQGHALPSRQRGRGAACVARAERTSTPKSAVVVTASSTERTCPACPRRATGRGSRSSRTPAATLQRLRRPVGTFPSSHGRAVRDVMKFVKNSANVYTFSAVLAPIFESKT